MHRWGLLERLSPNNLKMNTEIRQRNGLIIKIYTKDSYIYDGIWRNKAYGMAGFKFRKGMHVLDIGAHQGFFSLFVANRGAIVYAFEPDEYNFKILKWNIDANKFTEKIKIFKLAVSDENGATKLFIPIDDNDGLPMQGVISTSENFVKSLGRYYKKIRVSKVKSIDLDDFLSKAPVARWDLMKIDCEGAEYKILTHLSDANLRKIQRIVMETHEGYNEKELLGLLRDSGFRVVYYAQRGRSRSGDNGLIKVIRAPSLFFYLKNAASIGLNLSKRLMK